MGRVQYKRVTEMEINMFTWLSSSQEIKIRNNLIFNRENFIKENLSLHALMYIFYLENFIQVAESNFYKNYSIFFIKEKVIF